MSSRTGAWFAVDHRGGLREGFNIIDRGLAISALELCCHVSFLSWCDGANTRPRDATKTSAAR